MTTTLERLCRAVVAAAFLLLAVPASHAAEGAQSPDTDLSRAQALLERGQPYTALAILVPLARSDPKREDVLFLLGLAAIEAARRQPETAEAERERLLELAIAALHTILVDRPELVRVRLELARAFFLNGEDSLARGHFERVLAGEVPEAVAANVQQFLAQIRARRRWSMYLGATLAPDTNIGAGSDEEIIYIYGLPFQRDNVDELTTSGVGVLVWTGGEYQHPLGDRLRLRAGADLARTEHAGRKFDNTNLSGHVGPRWLVDRHTELSLLANVRRRWAAGNIDQDDIGARIEARQRLTPQVTGRAQASWHRRDYRGRDHLNGPVADILLSGTWTISPILQANAAFGHGRQRPRTVAQRNRSHRVRTGLSAALPRGFTVGASVQLRWTDYAGAQPPFTPAGESREDRTDTLSASLYNRTFTLYGFSPQLVVTREVRRSNAQLQDYDRLRGEVRFVRQF